MPAEHMVLMDTRTDRPAGDHGTANQAIEWALDHSPDGPLEAGVFLQAWREGSLEEWPEFYEWLKSAEEEPTP